MPKPDPGQSASSDCDFCGNPRDHYHDGERVWPMVDGKVLYGAAVDRRWQKESTGHVPVEWSNGLWALDHAVQEAIKGAWTDDEIKHEIEQLIESYRGVGEVGDA